MPHLPPDLLNWTPAAPPTPVTLRGRYVAVEPLDPASHADALWQALHGHDELFTWLAQGPYSSQSEMIESLERWRQAEQAILLAIIPAETGHHPGSPRTGLSPWGGKPGSPRTGLNPWGAQAAGWASYMRANPAHGVIEVGNVLFSPQLQRTRAATEAMYLMAGHVFDHLGYRRYEWKCNAENAPSRRAALRLGFTFEGIFRQHMVIKDRNRDSAWFSMLDKEWPARKQAFESWLKPSNFDAAGRQLSPLGQLHGSPAVST